MSLSEAAAKYNEQEYTQAAMRARVSRAQGKPMVAALVARRVRVLHRYGNPLGYRSVY